MFSFQRRGTLIVISAPSGCGKSSILRAILPRLDSIDYSISVTSRPPRGDEVDGREYYFVDQREFENRIARNEFIEFAEVHGHYYGTPREAIVESLRKGIDVLMDIDVQGGMQVRDKVPEAILIFIAPPSIEELEKRLRSRNTDSEEVIQLRLKNAINEMSFWPRYDYVVTNETLEDAVKSVETIIRSERCRTTRLNLTEISHEA